MSWNEAGSLLFPHSSYEYETGETSTFFLKRTSFFQNIFSFWIPLSLTEEKCDDQLNGKKWQAAAGAQQLARPQVVIGGYHIFLSADPDNSLIFSRGVKSSEKWRQLCRHNQNSDSCSSAAAAPNFPMIVNGHLSCQDFPLNLWKSHWRCSWNVVCSSQLFVMVDFYIWMREHHKWSIWDDCASRFLQSSGVSSVFSLPPSRRRAIHHPFIHPSIIVFFLIG